MSALGIGRNTAGPITAWRSPASNSPSSRGSPPLQRRGLLLGSRRMSVSTFKLVMRVLFGVLFILAGLNHFRVPEFYVNIMPPYLPWPRELVYLSGVCEVVLG